MEQFKPLISILAVDESDAVVTFDFASASDVDRSPKALRIPRKFSELRVIVAPFEVLGSSNDRREYRGAVKLLVKLSQSQDIAEYTLAEPHLWLPAEGRSRKRGATPNFPSSDDVTAAVRAGVAGSLSTALATFYGNEAHIDALTRSPARATAAVVAAGDLRPAPAPAHSFRGPVSSAIPANDESPSGRFSKKKPLFWAVVATPVVVFGLLAAAGGSLRKSDPIHDAVASAMAHNPSSTQAQVELTKETLKQMGLDPGKSGDIGCLAPN